jgi:tRNA(Ile)-lysidine synthase
MRMADSHPLLLKLRHALRPTRALAGGAVVAVSGGPDSVALLRALAATVRGRLVVAHLNHGLRGADGDADEAFVAELVETLRRDAGADVTFRRERVDVAAAAAGANLEATARRIRYDWFARVARAEGVPFVATGHTADDQAETVLHRLLRGTGLPGLAGIAARRPLADGVTLVRLMLHVTRAEVLDYLRSLGQVAREDRTNAELCFTRNRIRHELLPHLALHYNPRVAAVLGRLAAQAAAAQRELAAGVAELLAAGEKPRAGALLVFDRAVLAAAPRPRLRALWRRVWEREGWPRQAMGFREWDRLAALCSGGPAALDLPGRVRARRRERVIQVGPSDGGCDV